MNVPDATTGADSVKVEAFCELRADNEMPPPLADTRVAPGEL